MSNYPQCETTIYLSAWAWASELSTESQAIFRSTAYMDDLLVGSNQEMTLLEAVQEVDKRYQESGFKFHKMATNSKILAAKLRSQVEQERWFLFAIHQKLWVVFVPKNVAWLNRQDLRPVWVRRTGGITITHRILRTIVFFVVFSVLLLCSSINLRIISHYTVRTYLGKTWQYCTEPTSPADDRWSAQKNSWNSDDVGMNFGKYGYSVTSISFVTYKY